MKASKFIGSKLHKACSGMTLIEVMSSLAVLAVVIGGALALFGAASASQGSTQMTSDMNALRTGTRQLYLGQGNYGGATTNLNGSLISANKVPSTMNSTVTAGAGAVVNVYNGQVNVISNAGNTGFTVDSAAIPYEVCVNVLSSIRGWDSVNVAGTTTVTGLIAPTTPGAAATSCGTKGTAVKMTFVSAT
jgi:prepilin-type N-terminal cleavage/methylation domain-containing protein